MRKIAILILLLTGCATSAPMIHPAQCLENGLCLYDLPQPAPMKRSIISLEDMAAKEIPEGLEKVVELYLQDLETMWPELRPRLKFLLEGHEARVLRAVRNGGIISGEATSCQGCAEAVIAAAEGDLWGARVVAEAWALRVEERGGKRTPRRCELRPASTRSIHTFILHWTSLQEKVCGWVDQAKEK